MTPEETGGYIRHHLQLAGRDGDLFSDDAASQIHDASRGKPRTVNNLAIAALIATYATGKKIVDQSAARAAISEVISTE
jgi:type II secretory pathway predicted ATPase ExeA